MASVAKLKRYRLGALCQRSLVSVWAETLNLQLEGALDLQLHQDGLPENSTFRQTVINLTKDIWESHRWPEIMTLVFWPETRHHWSCLPERLQHRGFCLLFQRPFFFFFPLEQFSKKHLHKDSPQRNNDELPAQQKLFFRKQIPSCSNHGRKAVNASMISNC